jgi:hypothetical protein
MNPAFYIFDLDQADAGVLKASHTIPYADSDHPEIAEKLIAKNLPLEHSHTLTDQIGGQLDAGFHMIGMYEDRHKGFIIGDLMPTYIATRARKP